MCAGVASDGVVVWRVCVDVLSCMAGLVSATGLPCAHEVARRMRARRAHAASGET